jgi:transcriptional/translational regulatory protein YebC/TACO1
MSGHSKWHTTKRHKAVIDAKRGKIFSVLAKEITLAARAGGGSPESNARLRTLMDKARASNMPSDNIKRAVQKGTGEIPGVTYEEIVYEGYAPRRRRPHRRSHHRQQEPRRGRSPPGLQRQRRQHGPDGRGLP